MTKDKRTHDVLIDVWNKAEPYFKFLLSRVVKSLPATRDPWRVAPEDKKQKVHVLAGSRESEIAVFPNAIAIGSPATEGGGRGREDGGIYWHSDGAGDSGNRCYVFAFRWVFVLFVYIYSDFVVLHGHSFLHEAMALRAV
ncbi:hypothetical protein [Rhodanobacter glycinis]|uniref:Uncharacterized protein n=1 Tax=Rhodanobacter glycinis TaxID=582702 RepID=A0A1I4GAL6_9GAMM|nr:hypothetical protein [Rhodanobacter glycinis]SFL26919.1 hypothetical protein SAMN05192579_1236 [Rhodanobacter glycinis]